MKKKMEFSVGSGSIILRSGSANQDQNETDPRHCAAVKNYETDTMYKFCVDEDPTQVFN